MRKKNEEDIIYMSDILHVLYTSRMPILILSIIGLLLGMTLSIVSYVRSEMSKGYYVTTAIAVTSTTEDGLFTTRSNMPNSTDIRLAEEIVDSVIYVLKSDSTLNAAIVESDFLGITASDIRKNLTAKQYNQTQIVEMTLKWSVEEEGIRILEAINKVAPSIMIESLKVGGVSVIDQPKTTNRTASMINIKLWFFMTAVGMIVGSIYAVIKLIIFPTVFAIHHIEDNFNLEVIGEIPKNKTYFLQKCPLPQSDTETDDHGVRESFISLAHILRHHLSKEKPVCLFVTSTLANEGKTSVLANLAIQLVSLKHRVLMVDLDVCNPNLGGLFLDKVDYYHSLNAVYRDEISVFNAAVHITKNLDLLPVFLEHKPLELNDVILDAVKELSAKYDYVLIDTAPVGQFANTMNLNKVAQSALFVVRHDSTLISEIDAALSRLKKAGIPVVGAVLNAVSNFRNIKYYHYLQSNEQHHTNN